MQYKYSPQCSDKIIQYQFQSEKVIASKILEAVVYMGYLKDVEKQINQLRAELK